MVTSSIAIGTAVLQWASAHPLSTIGGLLLLLNVKSIPSIWHVRLLSALGYHTKLKRRDVVTAERNGDDSIFQSIVTKSRSPLWECDLSMHKSNSTYFSDLDINRIHLLAKLFKAASDTSLRPRVEGQMRRKWGILLSSTCCTFRREIKPYQAYEIHSRVLAWEGKWVYIVSHFVQPDARLRCSQTAGKEASSNALDLVFASAISKYVFKEGRKTIDSEEALKVLGLVPGDAPGKDEVEAMRQQGMDMAVHLLALDSMHANFAETVRLPSLGQFGVLGIS